MATKTTEEKTTTKKKTLKPASESAAARTPGEGTPASTGRTTKAERREKATGKRVGAVCFWLLGLAMEIVAILILNKTLWLPFIQNNQMLVLIGLIVLDLIFTIIGSQFWKRANDVDPASEKNKVKFFLWNQMGLIVSVINFFPLILILLNNKELDKKTKKIVTAVAIVALAISGLTSADYDAISEEQKNQMEEEITGDVYFTTFGKKYHIYQDCQAIANSENVYYGSITDAIDAGRTSECKFCAEREAKEAAGN